MPTEQEELKLIVTLVDNASAGLDKIVEKTKEMGGPQMKEAHAKMTEGTKELNKAFKEITGGFGDAFKALGEFRGGLVAGVGGLAIFGAAVSRQVGEIAKLAAEMRSLNQAARAIGVDPTSMKNIIDQFEAIGVSADQTKANLGKMAGAVADLSHVGSALRQDLMHMAGSDPESRRAMDEFLTKVTQARTEEERYNAVAAAAEKVRQHAYEQQIARGATQQQAEIEAANRRNEFASRFWDSTMVQMQRLQQMHEEERTFWKERYDSAEKLANKFGEIKSTWGDIANVVSAPTQMMQNLKTVLDYIAPALEHIKDALIWLDKWASKPSAFGGSGKDDNKIVPMSPSKERRRPVLAALRRLLQQGPRAHRRGQEESAGGQHQGPQGAERRDQTKGAVGLSADVGHRI